MLEDADGAPHTSLIRSILVPTGHELEAVEKTETNRPGYRFAVLGDFDDQWELFQRLFASIRDAVSTRHVRRSEFGWQLTSAHRLVGRIEWDPKSEARLPLVVSNLFSWYEVGHMLMKFEGVHARGARQGHHRACRRGAVSSEIATAAFGGGPPSLHVS